MDPDSEPPKNQPKGPKVLILNREHALADFRIQRNFRDEFRGYPGLNEGEYQDIFG